MDRAYEIWIWHCLVHEMRPETNDNCKKTQDDPCWKGARYTLIDLSRFGRHLCEARQATFAIEHRRLLVNHTIDNRVPLVLVYTRCMVCATPSVVFANRRGLMDDDDLAREFEVRPSHPTSRLVHHHLHVPTYTSVSPRQPLNIAFSTQSHPCHQEGLSQ